MQRIANTKTIQDYAHLLGGEAKRIGARLAREISAALPEADSKIWHGSPVWFLAGNPVVGYSQQKAGIKLMFWSGADFAEPQLVPGTGKFKDASITYTAEAQISSSDLERWLGKARRIQWDYKNIVKNRGLLLRPDSTKA